MADSVESGRLWRTPAGLNVQCWPMSHWPSPVVESCGVHRSMWGSVQSSDFGIEHNSWEPWDNLHAPDLVADFRKHPGAVRHIRATDFAAIHFHNVIVPRRHYLKEGVDVRGHSAEPALPSADLVLPPLTSAELVSSSLTLAETRYVPPHRRQGYTPLANSVYTPRSRPLPFLTGSPHLASASLSLPRPGSA